MALIKDIATERGVLYPQQYCRVDSVNALKTSMQFDVGVYFNEQTAKNNTPPHRVETYFGPFDLYSNNLWIQAYDILKQKWPDAQDA